MSKHRSKHRPTSTNCVKRSAKGLTIFNNCACLEISACDRRFGVLEALARRGYIVCQRRSDGRSVYELTASGRYALTNINLALHQARIYA